MFRKHDKLFRNYIAKHVVENARERWRWPVVVRMGGMHYADADYPRIAATRDVLYAPPARCSSQRRGQQHRVLPAVVYILHLHSTFPCIWLTWAVGSVEDGCCLATTAVVWCQLRLHDRDDRQTRGFAVMEAKAGMQKRAGGGWTSGAGVHTADSSMYWRARRECAWAWIRFLCGPCARHVQ